MNSTRRFLPPIHLLSAFEAVARHQSITLAAEELSLTQGAVSRQILNLEILLDIGLFERRRKRLYLTDHGARYLTDIRVGLDAIKNATISLTANRGGGILNLAILPTFGTHWLAPKLPSFLSENPGITINLSTRFEPFDFKPTRFDAAIFFGDGKWPGVTALKLQEERLVAACSPDLMQRHQFKSPADLLKVPLLSLSTRPGTWKNWLDSHGVEQPPPKGMVFDQFATLAQATKHGMGIGLLPLFLIEDEMKAGNLVAAYGQAILGSGAYYLVWPDNPLNPSPVERLSQWLLRNYKECREVPD